MKQSTFLLIVAALSLIFGGMMFFTPENVAEEFGSTPTVFSSFLLREMGLILLCASAMNFMARKDTSSPALRAILVFNMAYHLIMIPIVLMAVSNGLFTIDKAIPGLVAHVFIGLGSLIYLIKKG